MVMNRTLVTLSSTRLYEHELNNGDLYYILNDMELYNKMVRYVYKLIYLNYSNHVKLPYPLNDFLMEKFQCEDCLCKSAVSSAFQIFYNQKRGKKIYNEKLKRRMNRIDNRIYQKRKLLEIYENLKLEIVACFKKLKNYQSNSIFIEYFKNSIYLYEVKIVDFKIKIIKKEIKQLLLKKKRCNENYLKEIRSICFGGRKILKELSLNREDHYGLLAEYRDRRNSTMTILGNSMNIYGNDKFKFFNIGEVEYRYKNAEEVKHLKMLFDFKYRKQDFIDAKFYKTARGNSKKICYTLVRKNQYFILKATFSKRIDCSIIYSYRGNGVIGIDLNVDHVALVEIDERGNIKYVKNYSFNLSGKNKRQREFILRNVVKKIFNHCVLVQKPLIMENLDFSKYKEEKLYSISNRGRKIISEFMYSKFRKFVISRALKDNIGVYLVNPIYTSFIGKVKYQKNHGLTIHQAAAYVIARRAMNFQEKIPKELFKKYKFSSQDSNFQNWQKLYNLMK